MHGIGQGFRLARAGRAPRERGLARRALERSRRLRAAIVDAIGGGKAPGGRGRGVDFLRRAATLAAASSLALSCAPAGGVTRSTRVATRESALDPAARGELKTAGLECVRWFLPLDPALRRDGIAKAKADGLAAAIEAPLGSNGLTLLRIDARRLPETLAALGGSPVARRTILGQADAWADLASASLAKGQPFLAAGRPQQSRDAIYRLALRGWCFPTVDGAAARVELRLTEEPTRMTTISIDPSQVRVRGSEMRSGSTTLELAPDEALIVLETPLVPPEQEGGDGPDASPPPTLAALFLNGTPFPDRATVLVILPSFADMLPTPAVSAAKPR